MRYIFLFSMLNALIFFSGCTSWSEFSKSSEKKCFIHLHTFSSTKTPHNQGYEYFIGENRVFVSPQPLMTSSLVQRISTKEVEGGKTLVLHLDSLGRSMWTQKSLVLRGNYVLVLIDKQFKGMFKVEQMNDRGIIELPGPFKEEEIERILKNQSNNYRF